jgi:hypothetical protein
MAGGVLRWSGEGEEAQAQVYPEKKVARGVLGAPLTVEGFTTAEVAEQRRLHAQTATWSASDMGDGVVGTGVREARRGRRRQCDGIFRHGPSETVGRNSF